MVVQANEVVAPVNDIESWSKVEYPEIVADNDYTNTMKLGLFGFDQTDFFEDCEIATQNCPLSDL